MRLKLKIALRSVVEDLSDHGDKNVSTLKGNSVFKWFLHNTHDMANLYEKTNLDE
jgi:hypothetical protein